jgi:muconolactone delta-isomerase
MYSDWIPSMKVMATMTFDPAQREEITAHIPAEQIRVGELMAQGTLEALYLAQAQSRAWLVLTVETEDEARRIMESLPLHAYATVELAVLR